MVGDQDVGLAVVVEVGDRGREGWRDGGVNGEGLDGAQAEGSARGAIAPGQAQAGAGEEGGVHKLGLQAGKEVQEEAGGLYDAVLAQMLLGVVAASVPLHRHRGQRVQRKYQESWNQMPSHARS